MAELSLNKVTQKSHEEPEILGNVLTSHSEASFYEGDRKRRFVFSSVRPIYAYFLLLPFGLQLLVCNLSDDRKHIKTWIDPEFIFGCQMYKI